MPIFWDGLQRQCVSESILRNMDYSMATVLGFCEVK